MKKILKKFEEIGDTFLARYIKPEYEEIVKESMRNGWKGWKTGLLFFVGYSFERQGRPPDWAHIAKEVIEKHIEKISNINELSKETVWKKFKEKWEELGRFDGKNKIGFNELLNPLAPKKTDYHREYKNGRKISGKTKKLSIVEFIKKELRNYEYDIMTFIKEELKKGCIIKSIVDELKKINGVSDKIASFFLRDVAVLFEKEINLDNIKVGERKHLQPIDVWVRRCCKYLTGNKKLTDNGCKEYIVKSCVENNKHVINPEKVNMGMWLFSSQIVGNHYKLSKIFEESEESEIVKGIENAIKKYISRGRKEIDELNKIVSR